MSYKAITQLLGVAAVAAGTIATQVPARAAEFDGGWSVQIITEKGTCDRAYSYGIEVRNGALIYGAGGPVALTGRVESNGRVRARISHGSQFADAVGRLSRASGGGTWRGHAASGICSGRWEAERRS